MGHVRRSNDRRDEEGRRSGTDRRQLSMAVDMERRSGEDRRLEINRRTGFDRRLYSTFFLTI